MAVNFDIDKILGNVNAQVSIVWGTDASQMVRCFTMADIAMSGSNSFDTPFEISALDKWEKGLSVAQGLIAGSGLGNFNAGGLSLKSFIQTTNLWTSSTRPGFQIPVLFVQIREGIDIRDEAAKLWKTVYPTEGAGAEALGGTMSPPLGYYPILLPDVPPTAVGLIDIQVGQLVQFTNMNMKEVNLSLAQQVTKDGPVVIHGTISFEPFRMISADEMANYMVTP